MNQQDLVKYVEDESKANISIRNVEKLPATELGITQSTTIPTQGVERTTRILDAFDKAEIKIIKSQTEWRLTCLHEIGHALGLQHSPDKKDVMYPTQQPECKLLSQRDKATIYRLYSENANEDGLQLVKDEAFRGNKMAQKYLAETTPKPSTANASHKK